MRSPNIGLNYEGNRYLYKGQSAKKLYVIRLIYIMNILLSKSDLGLNVIIMVIGKENLGCVEIYLFAHLNQMRSCVGISGEFRLPCLGENSFH